MEEDFGTVGPLCPDVVVLGFAVVDVWVVEGVDCVVTVGVDERDELDDELEDAALASAAPPPAIAPVTSNAANTLGIRLFTGELLSSDDLILAPQRQSDVGGAARVPKSRWRGGGSGCRLRSRPLAFPPCADPPSFRDTSAVVRHPIHPEGRR